jgi:hypothetical protein
MTWPTRLLIALVSVAAGWIDGSPAPFLLNGVGIELPFYRRHRSPRDENPAK